MNRHEQLSLDFGPHDGFRNRMAANDPVFSTSLFAKATRLAYGSLEQKRLRQFVLQRDGYRCRSCDRGVREGLRLEMDHRVPLADGGNNSPSNLQMLCFRCHELKTSMDRWRRAMRQVAQWRESFVREAK